VKRQVLVIDDEINMQMLMKMILVDAGYLVDVAGCYDEAQKLLHQRQPDVIVTDLKMPGLSGEALVVALRRQCPGIPVIVVTAHGTIQSAVSSIREGAANYLTKPFQPEELELAVEYALRIGETVQENARLKASLIAPGGHHLLLGTSPAMQALQAQVADVAPYKTNVLITGESGTGKELVARSIHQLSPRSSHPWVAINCAAIPRDLMESELFGHVKGAFSGASQSRMGRIEQAHEGTLFLDEVGEMDLALQAKLLRVLQEKEFTPVGSSQLRKVDVRIIAATNRDLHAQVARGEFREDLLYRLDVYHIRVPALRERRDDVPLLAETFRQELVAEMGKAVRSISEEASLVMQRYAWPGNVRELRNVLERAVLTCRGDTIAVADLPQALLQRSSDRQVVNGAFGDLDSWLAEQERNAIVAALQQCDGIQVKAAQLLGINERSLWHRIKKLGIQVERSASIGESESSSRR
jgi:two-component system response regulator AtoC